MTLPDGLYAAGVAALALGVDLLVGDPQGWPHPVRLIGAGLDRLETLADRAAPQTAPSRRKLFGAACVLLMAGGSWFAARTLCGLPAAGGLLALYLAYAGLSLGGLLAEARKAEELIESGDLKAARKAVGMLVSRETGHLDAAALRRALAETTAENVNDGFTAPFFYLVIGGPALLWAYKAVSTMDSMWGYLTPRYKDLGLACARTDDVLAFIPARLTALAFMAAAVLAGRGEKGMFRRIRRDAAKSKSPNAGWPMAAGAWTAGASMGGRAVYFGQASEKPVLGPPGVPWNRERLALLRRLSLAASLGLASCLMLVRSFL